MRVVVQRVNKAQVTIDNEVVGKIKRGFLLLVGLREGDELDQVKKAADKIVKMRIFEDEDGKTNLSLKDVNGEILSVIYLRDRSFGERADRLRSVTPLTDNSSFRER